MPACGSPWLFAAGRVLLRPLAPRHPPYALPILTLMSMCGCQGAPSDRGCPHEVRLDVAVGQLEYLSTAQTVAQGTSGAAIDGSGVWAQTTVPRPYFFDEAPWPNVHDRQIARETDKHRESEIAAVQDAVSPPTDENASQAIPVTPTVPPAKTRHDPWESHLLTGLS